MTTTVVSTIGSDISRDYSTPQAWEDDSPADLTAVDQVWQGELYNDSEFVDSTIGLVNAGGVLCDATRYMHLTVAAGESFIDNPATSAADRKYDPALGVALRNTGGSYYRGLGGNEGFGTIFKVSRIQGKAPRAFVANRTDGPFDVSQCLFECTDSTSISSFLSTSEGTFKQNLIVCMAPNTSGAVRVSYSSKFFGNTLVLVSDASSTDTKGVWTNYATSKIFNNAVFGFDTAFYEVTPHGSDSDADYNATDDSYAPGSHSLTGLTYADQFVGVTSGAMDFKPKSGGALIGAGVFDSTNSPIDLLDRARSNPPTIGAEEFVSGGGPAIFANPFGLLGVGRVA